MAKLALHLHAELELNEHAHDELACLDAGLRELARRLAWQAAAAFCKRIPHGSFSPSNVALSGAYLDCGLTSFIPHYLRHGWLAWSDPWEELNAPLPLLVTLRQQLEKYHPICGTSSVVNSQDLISTYQNTLNVRLRIEFARMAGLTEDLAVACPPPLLENWLKVMLEVARRGAGDRQVPFSGHMADGSTTPPGNLKRYRLNTALARLWDSDDPDVQDAILAPMVPDAALRVQLVHGASAVRTALAIETSATADTVAAYFASQARRKNESLETLHREAFAHRCRSELDLNDADNLAVQLQAMLKSHVARGRYVLNDIDQGLPGTTGREQMSALAAKRQLQA